MFICKKCLEEKFTNFAIAFSYGKCEICDYPALCVDIPSKYLNKKEQINPETGEIIKSN